MPTAERPAVFTIAPHVAFVDALAQGLLDRTGGDMLQLARTRVFLPNRRAVRALTDAFVRLSDNGLLLPRMTPIGDLDDDSGSAFADEFGGAVDLPPPLDGCQRRLLLTQLVRNGAQARGDALTAVEALRLADALARALDTLTAEEIDASALAELGEDFATHFEATLEQFRAVLDHWPAVLAALGASDAAARTNAVTDALAAHWRGGGAPPGLVVAAGLVAVAPPVARLLGVIARLPQGLVVLPGVDTAMPDAEWDAVVETGEAHPQYAFHRLLDRMSVGRGEVADWPHVSAHDGPGGRTPVVARAMSLAAFTDQWREPVDATVFDGVRVAVAATPEEEAQIVALALREVLQTPGKTAALVTPDRGLARRVAAHLSRWGIDIDDSAGQPLRQTPPGTLLLALAEAATQGFAPVPLLAVLKHPLVRRGDERLEWLAGARRLDLDLRGIRPAPGLRGIAARVEAADVERGKRGRAPQWAWWAEVELLLRPLAAAFSGAPCSLAEVIAVLRDTGEALAGDELWRGPAGRALADVVAALTTHGHHLQPFDAEDAPPLIAAFLRDAPVREAYSKHPRLAIYGSLEARLQRADRLILGGLNEGVWPARPAPDPWLAPAVRARLGLGGLHRATGLAAHDFVAALGGREVLLTRSRRDDSAPAVASRFWLRLRASTGDAIGGADDLSAAARALDRPDAVTPATQPAPAPPAALRPRTISVTAAERLRADPFSFYAATMLRLSELKQLDEDPGAAERGIDLHGVLEDWVKRGADAELLPVIAEEMLRSKWSNHPLMRALWKPRVDRALEWVVAESARWADDEGWTGRQAEAAGVITLDNGITLKGRADRIDRNRAGEQAIIDYKTGAVPNRKQVEGGFALQMGLLGWMAEHGRFGPAAPVTALRYWKLGGGKDPGKATDPLMLRGKPIASISEHIAATFAQFSRLCDAYLLGDEAFTAKLHPEYAARYTDFDHLARVAEWHSRPRR